MEQKGKFKLYSSEEVLDMHFGKIGTPRRDDFERSVAASKPEETVIAIINGDSSITPELALSLENITKIPTNFWINRQRNYDEYMTSSRKTEPIWNR